MSLGRWMREARQESHCVSSLDRRQFFDIEDTTCRKSLGRLAGCPEPVIGAVENLGYRNDFTECAHSDWVRTLRRIVVHLPQLIQSAIRRLFRGKWGALTFGSDPRNDLRLRASQKPFDDEGHRATSMGEYKADVGVARCGPA